MLYLDLNTPDEVLSNELQSRCKLYGDVQAVTMQRLPAACATVRMKTHADAVRVRIKLGDSLIGRFVTIKLSQKNGGLPDDKYA